MTLHEASLFLKKSNLLLCYFECVHFSVYLFWQCGLTLVSFFLQLMSPVSFFYRKKNLVTKTLGMVAILI